LTGARCQGGYSLSFAAGITYLCRRVGVTPAGIAPAYFSGDAIVSDTSLPETIVTTKPKEKEAVHTHQLPPYHVILENDDHHSFEFVMDVLRKVLAFTQQRAFAVTQEAHTRGRAIAWTGSKEVAELKVDQIQSFHEIHADGRKLGPLGVSIEPAC
jgi:ATP-dependent Clp protease adaptor protein ClpS